MYCRARFGPTWMIRAGEARGKKISPIFPELLKHIGIGNEAPSEGKGTVAGVTGAVT